MNENSLKTLLSSVANGATSIDAAMEQLRHMPFESLTDDDATTFAHIDHHRALRCGHPETIFCSGKTTPQIVDIFSRLAATGHNVLATRATQEHFDAVHAQFPAANYESLARCITLRQIENRKIENSPYIALVAAGTADLPVAEEARVTVELLDQPIKTLYDVGVAGLHRLLLQRDVLTHASVVIAVAGMEGALPSVVAGLVDCPVIAVPTSVGYGVHLHGLAPLLAMLNACTPNLAVVNIDNGFSAATLAALINKQAKPKSL